MLESSVPRSTISQFWLSFIGIESLIRLMDFNDLSSKLKRLYIAVGEHYSEDIGSNIVDTHITEDDGRFIHQTTFGTNDHEKNISIVMNAVHSMSVLKDVIKQKLRSSGKNPQLYEDFINNNVALALITDIDNKEKHGDPLRDPLRSGKDPKIVNIEQVLHGKGRTNILFTTNFVTGKTILNKVEGDVKIEVVADIVDGDGSLIMPLGKMLEDSFEAIYDFMARNDLHV